MNVVSTRAVQAAASKATELAPEVRHNPTRRRKMIQSLPPVFAAGLLWAVLTSSASATILTTPLATAGAAAPSVVAMLKMAPTL